METSIKLSNKQIPKIGPLQAPSPRTEELWHEPHNAQHSARQNDRRTACRALPDSDKEWKAPIQLKPNTEDCSLSLDSFSLRIPPNHVGQGFLKTCPNFCPKLPKTYEYHSISYLNRLKTFETLSPQKLAKVQCVLSVGSSTSHHHCFCWALH